MNHIEDFLKNIRDRFNKKTIDMDKISEILTKTLGRNISKESIVYKNFILNIKEKPIVKSAISLKKDKIIFLIEDETGLKIKDIR
jgi:hypothetical protein